MARHVDVWFLRFLPSDVASRSDDWLLRAKLWIIITAITTSIALVMGIDHLIRGPRIWGGVLLFGTFLLLGLYRVFQRTGKLEVVGNIISALWIIGLIGATYVRGGAGSPGMMMAGIVPMLTVLYTGWRSGFAWACVVLLMQAVFTLAYALDYTIPIRVSEESQLFSDTALSFVLTLVLSGVALGYEGFRIATNRARAEAERTRHDADHELELSRADRLASIGQISAGVAHEINNPLAYILGNLDFIRDGLSDPQGYDADWLEDMDASIVDAIDGAKRIQQIVLDLNTFSRREEEEIESFELQTSIHSAVKMIDNQLRHSATLKLELGSPAWVRGDASRFTQVFLNILINATQALEAREGQENHISISLSSADDMVTVRIRDTGVGIPAELLHRANDPFFTTKTVGEGTGLGLSVSRNLVERYHGELTLESEVGVGTCVILSFPEVAAPPHLARTEDTSKDASDRLRILLVDDDELILRLLSRTLKSHQLSQASSGPEAIEILSKRNDFDAILCDLMMPGTTGIDVYDKVRERDPELAARFVFISGGVFGEAMEKRLAALNRPVLSKPIDREMLRETLLAMPRART